jgi:hypothetical protein
VLLLLLSPHIRSSRLIPPCLVLPCLISLRVHLEVVGGGVDVARHIGSSGGSSGDVDSDRNNGGTVLVVMRQYVPGCMARGGGGRWC